jgi:hypothetical protein
MNSLLSGFSRGIISVGLRHTGSTMFVFNRSAAAVLLPLALLLGVVIWSNATEGGDAHGQNQSTAEQTTVHDAGHAQTLTAANNQRSENR